MVCRAVLPCDGSWISYPHPERAKWRGSPAASPTGKAEAAKPEGRACRVDELRSTRPGQAERVCANASAPGRQNPTWIAAEGPPSGRAFHASSTDSSSLWAVTSHVPFANCKMKKARSGLIRFPVPTEPQPPLEGQQRRRPHPPPCGPTQQRPTQPSAQPNGTRAGLRCRLSSGWR